MLIRSDLGSIREYTAQKNIEGQIFLKAPSALPEIDPNNFPIWGLEGETIDNIRFVASTVLDFFPLVGTIKSVSELISGYDYIGGQDVSRTITACGLVFGLVPGGKSAVKYVAKAISNPKVAQKVIAKLVRAMPGKATGGTALPLIKEGDVWLRGTHANAGKVPKQIAEKLRGRQFSSWDDFRRNFWKEVAEDPVLSKGFDASDLHAMRHNGIAPVVAAEQQIKKLDSYILHHEKPIYDGGGVYNMDNIRIVTPRYHKEVLEQKYHYNKL